MYLQSLAQYNKTGMQHDFEASGSSQMKPYEFNLFHNSLKLQMITFFELRRTWGL